MVEENMSHDKVAGIYFELGSLSVITENLEDATFYYNKYSRMIGENMSQETSTGIYCDLGKLQDAKLYYNKSLEIMRRTYRVSVEHPKVASTLASLAYIAKS